MKHSRILIVEADASIGPLLAEMLEDLGAVVCAVELDIAKAARAVERCHPNLMIVDVGWGEASDLTALKEVAHEADIPCVLATDILPRTPWLWPGAVFIRKPFRGPEIVVAIRRAMNGSKRSAIDAST